MTDLSQLVRWNAGFVRGLAQSVLERAKTIRTSLTGAEVAPAQPKTVGKSAKAKRKPSVKTAVKTARRPSRKRAAKRRDA